MQMMSRYIVVLCAFLLVWMPTAAYAGDVVPPPPRTDLSSIQLGKVSQLRLGQRAPFAGVLLSDTAAAKLFGELKFTEQECKLRIARELNINTIWKKTLLPLLGMRQVNFGLLLEFLVELQLLLFLPMHSAKQLNN